MHPVVCVVPLAMCRTIKDVINLIDTDLKLAWNACTAVYFTVSFRISPPARSSDVKTIERIAGHGMLARRDMIIDRDIKSMTASKVGSSF